MSAFSAASDLSFPRPELTKIQGKPNYLSLETLKAELYDNASSIFSIRGNGQLGHAVLVLGDAEYNRVANLAAGGGNAFNWLAIAHPGNAPVIPNNATQAQIAHLRDAHAVLLKEFTVYNAVETALKRQLLEAVDDSYICSLKHRRYNYANVSVRQLLVHLDTTYGQLDDDALEVNKKMLNEQWEANEQMETLWERYSSIQAVAEAGGDPITDATVLRAARSVLVESGVFDLDLRDWDGKPAANKTWANFKPFFTEANKKRIKKTTAGQLQGSPVECDVTQFLSHVWKNEWSAGV